MPLVNKAFSDIITFTRASSATYFDALGTLTTATSGNPRFDYDPVALTPRGFLVEEQRTNSIRNNTMVGAVVGTPGTLPTNWVAGTAGTGLTVDVVAVGTVSGISYVDLRISGTAAAGNVTLAFESNTQIAASTGQTWTESLWAALVAGSTSGITGTQLNIVERTSGGAFVTQVFGPGITFTPTLTRQPFATTLNGGATTAYVVPRLNLNLTIGAAIDITLRIGMPQMEQGAFATSVIPTSTVAVTRSADSAVVNTLSPWYRAAVGTLFVEVNNYDTTSGVFPRAVQFNDGTLNNVIQISRNNASGAARMSVTAGGVSQAAADTGTWTLNTNVKAALAYAENDFAISANGGAPVTDTSGTVPSVTTLQLGAAAGLVGVINGWLRRVTYYPRRLTNAELQTITT